ncbi:hypothetical protein AB0F77_03910 [Streptomyces sp. NPDC026672]|uniref:hypothetical protein n=1 Tax=unclassified Streptomyces TaxID=2593676 RepID=UPI0033E21911
MTDDRAEAAYRARDRYAGTGDPEAAREALEAHEEHVRLARDADSLDNLGNRPRVCHDETGDEHLLERAAGRPR